jgi:hypothetical protein
MDSSITRLLLLLRLLDKLPPPPDEEEEAALNHLDTSIVRENSFLDVPSFFGPVFSIGDASLSSLAENNIVDVRDLILRLVITIDLGGIDVRSAIGCVVVVICGGSTPIQASTTTAAAKRTTAIISVTLHRRQVGRKNLEFIE